MSLVLVTESEFRKAEDVFRAAAPPLDCRPAASAEDALAAAVTASGARYLVVGHLPYRGPLYDALAPGSVIARFGVGYDSLDLPRATARGIVCTNTPGVLDQSVAEHAMGLVAAAARRFAALPAQLEASVWAPPVGVELAGKTLAIIGCGRIGRATARIAARGYGMIAVGYSRTLSAPPTTDFARVTADFADAVGGAHFVSLHLPATVETRHFIGRDRLALFTGDAWLINTARGAVVDETALHDALATGRLAGAALDVFEREPYVPVDAARDLRRLPNVILTPHIGSHTTEANHAMAKRALRNIELAESGRLSEMDRIG
jgi:phosphoglycerate dehydrogenase-like enzyme